MANRIAPHAYRMAPKPYTLPAGTELWRCHKSTRPADGFNPVAVDAHFGGNRFDGTADDPYPYLYAGAGPATALAEVFLRDLDFDVATGMRLLPYAAIAGKSLSVLRTRTDLTLIPLLTEEDLADVCQDSWLLEADGPSYAQTRRWAAELRAQVPTAQGLVWQSRRHRPRQAMVFFGDRCADEPFKDGGDGADGDPAGAGIPDLGSPGGLAKLNRLLAPLRAAVVPPAG
ncbi:RES family NAD+ phosphorylase [Streptomyces sp. NPDC048483]|uniref:RES family NAD+ phosphorylase n=1 Tax=Streptomyces sp. NPDC048483 TaxID=3154927 RepID=UPI00341814AD